MGAEQLPQWERTRSEREREGGRAGKRGERERGRSIESPLRRVSGGVARWNHAAAGGLFSVYICRSITLDPVGCRCVGRVRCFGAAAQLAARGTNLGTPTFVRLCLTVSLASFSFSLPPSLANRQYLFHSIQAAATLDLGENLRGIRTLDRMPLFERSGSTRQMLNNGYVFIPFEDRP